MVFVIPMAGLGQRFTAAGYQGPKYLLEAHGKTLLEWSVGSLPLALAEQIIFIGLAQHLRNAPVQASLERATAGRPFRWVLLEEPTGGQAETVLAATEWIDHDSDLLIFNIDTAFRSPTLHRRLQQPREKRDGILGSFPGEGNHWSFARIDPGGRVEETAEKIRIADHALTGLYHFSRGSDFVRVARQALARQERNGGEYYIAPLYNQLIREGRHFVLDPVDLLIPLGTPQELERFRQAEQPCMG
ncbi:MAG: glycosyltransferase family 2 protein [Magnetococcales bacterium]|nr:glycosyltransferase family 2 protein [Magnetococcales bacterium]